MEQTGRNGWGITSKAGHLLRDRGTKGFLLGLGAAALSAYALPRVSKALRPIAVKATQEAIHLYDSAVTKLSEWKEDVEDIVAEAQVLHVAETLEEGNVHNQRDAVENAPAVQPAKAPKNPESGE
ncbi:hypothetical protein GTO89_00490 [Heliobacterium gestii]|uniref:YtxH domain-containing protein n=1 Tax=Heliomicrobium gestii TaxID=2699 RepID=A0A845L9B0_HELGE|nr:hypothetical protein [Heliomicrobium gestii]MBM7865245.1 hypothetical protein [Heliomicrobium gestii]MZP41510.1 hypothetical protein [Heliomicrobium gestii]